MFTEPSPVPWRRLIRLKRLLVSLLAAALMTTASRMQVAVGAGDLAIPATQVAPLNGAPGLLTVVVSLDVAGYGWAPIEVSCPEGTVALSGGTTAAPLGAIVFSIGPTFSGGRLGLQANGTTVAPTGWRAVLGNGSYEDVTMKIAVLCTTDQSVQTIIGSSSPGPYGFAELSIPCPSGKMAVGGGVDPVSPATISDQVSSSAPTSPLGDWLGGYWFISSSSSFKVASVCSSRNDLVLRSTSTVLAPNAAWGASLNCDSGQVALGGGVRTTQLEHGPGQNECATITDTSPLFAGGLRLDQMADGQHEAPVGWRGMAWNRNENWTTSAEFFAICWEPERIYLPLMLR
jgi:hypothetical protein